jgi:hypothetical protein
MSRSQLDLVQIIASGGSIDVAAGGRSQQDLVQLAASTKTRGAKLTLRDISGRSTSDLVQIAAAAPGSVTFVFD